MKRQKKNFTSNEIAHVWANEGAPVGKCPSSMSFDGPAFYSYRTVIARILKNKAGERAYVLDVATFSPSTSGHQNHVRAAIAQGAKKFCVEIGWRSYEYSPGGWNSREQQFSPSSKMKRAAVLSQKLHRAMYNLDFTPAELRDFYLYEYRKETAEAESRFEHVRAADVLRKSARLADALEVCQFFGLASARVKKLQRKIATAAKKAREVVDAYEARKREKREAREKKARAHRIAGAIRWAENFLALTDPTPADADAAPYDLETLLTDAGRAGGKDRLPYHYSGPVLLRRVSRPSLESGGVSSSAWDEAAGDIMETSKGARVPIDEARKAYQFAQRVRAKGWHRNGEQFKIGYYDLDAVNASGIVAGCHRVSWAEAEQFAISQGWETGAQVAARLEKLTEGQG
jgi:hypothetical protein